MDYIAQALLILMRKQPFSDITIGEITKKAGVNRSTYYRHFASKESVVQFYLDSVMQEYQDKFADADGRDFTAYLDTMFATFFDKKEELLLIHGAGLSFLLRNVLMERFRFAEIPSAEQFRASYHIGGIYNNLLLWFDHGMQETPAEMVEMALKYSPKKAFTLFGKLVAPPSD